MENRKNILPKLKSLYTQRLSTIKSDRRTNKRYHKLEPEVLEHFDKCLDILELRISHSILHLEAEQNNHERLLDSISEASFKPGRSNEKLLLMSDYEESLSIFAKRVETLKQQIDMLDNPFFGVVTFETLEGESTVYIGKHGLVDENIKQLISDWRSEIGQYFYKEDESIISKKRLTFRGGVLTSVTDLKEDKYSILEVFKGELEERRGGSFKDIITTIQEDQSKIITEDPEVIYVIQGCAGSGKTSIAVHKLSHHIFNNQIDPSYTLYITPNKLFSDYLSDVQTSLGLEGVQFKTYHEWGSDILLTKTELFSDNLSVSFKYKPTSHEINTEELVDEEDVRNFVENSTEELVLNYLREMRNELEQYYRKEIPETVREIIAVDELLKITENSHDLSSLISEIKPVINSFPFEDGKHLKKFHKITLSIEFFSLYQSYIDSREIKTDFHVSQPILNDDEEYLDTEVRYSNYDIMNLLVFRKVTHGMRDVGHQALFIDEVQNYSNSEIKSLLSFSRRRQIMILGDIHQRTEKKGQKDLKDLTTLLSVRYPDQKIKFEVISKCYRTTKAIMEYSYMPFDGIVNDKYKAKVYFRDGQKPEVLKKNNLDEQLLKDIAKSSQKKNFTTIAVLGDDENLSSYLEKVVVKELGGYQLKERGDTDYQKGIFFLTNAESKGLEFDVVVYLRDLKEMHRGDGWTKASDDHIALSRALHRLVVVDLG